MDTDKIAALESRIEHLELLVNKLIDVARVHPVGKALIRSLGLK